MASSRTATQKRLEGSRLQRERRKNLRLRALVDDFQAGIMKNRRELELQFTRMADLQAEVDLLKRDASRR